jgi:chromosome segregation ATPase
MEGLRPERDELDRFQKRNTKSKQVKKPPSGEKTKVPSASRAHSPLMFGLLLLMLVMIGFLGWMHVKQAQAVSSLTKELDDAMSFVNQSKLLMARFEGELTEAGAELEQTGSSAEKKLAFLDSEMRKLWGVAGDRNKKAIEGNKSAVDGLAAKLEIIKSDQEKALKTITAKIDQSVKSTREELKVLGKLSSDMVLLEKMVASAASESALTRDSLEGQVDVLSKRIAKLSDESARSIENSKAISSIDASRQQLNERIVSLERKLNELKLQVAASKVQ